ncbi:MAG: serine hydrolase domain-containing protein [Pseudomonadota bacterium]
MQEKACKVRELVFVLVFFVAAYGCAAAKKPVADVDGAAEPFDGARLDRLLPTLIKEERVAGVGIAVIQNGETVWTGYYGEQGPGAPASAQTVFNTASVAKTITAETMIALEAKGLIDFDEPIAPFVAQPDLAGDPRYQRLTSRLLMSHRAGLLNWPYEYEDGRLAFDHDPGARFSYSGAGVELAARYAEAKTGKTLDALASEHVFDPIGVKEMAMGVIPVWADGRLATPMNAAGEYATIEATNPSLAAGDANSAADDLLATVPAYAALIEAMIASDGLSERSKAWRTTVLTSQEGDAVYNCPELQWLECPTAYGHGIGWQVFHYEDHVVVFHSGSDAGENAFVYWSPDTKNGAVIFVNGANGWVVMTRIIELIDDEPLLADYFLALIQVVMGRAVAPL